MTSAPKIVDGDAVQADRDEAALSRRTPPASTAAVRTRMQAQRNRDTGPELALRRRLHRRGLRYRVGVRIVPGTRRTADIVFGGAKIAVFVDGCFWHGCTSHRSQAPKANGRFWQEKIRSNVDRDRDTDRRLGDAGWTVIRVWEHDDMDEAAVRIVALVRGR